MKMEDQQQWIEEQHLILDQKAQYLAPPYQELMGIVFMKGALKLMPQKINNLSDWERFKFETAKLIHHIPVENDGKRSPAQKEHHKNLSLYKSYLMKKYNVVAKGYYVALWTPLGISIGLPFGLIFKNLALGIPIGLALGAAIGSYLTSVAKKENRVI